jgi:hypothetical protein
VAKQDQPDQPDQLDARSAVAVRAPGRVPYPGFGPFCNRTSDRTLIVPHVRFGTTSPSAALAGWILRSTMSFKPSDNGPSKGQRDTHLSRLDRGAGARLAIGAMSGTHSASSPAPAGYSKAVKDLGP